MLIDKVCVTCGKEFKVPHWRKDSAKYCSVDCQHSSLKAKPNMICPICGKPFHRKRSHIKRFKGELGFCCSKECDRKIRMKRMEGKGNHQYGLKGELNASFKKEELTAKNNKLEDVRVFVGNWYKRYNESGRITKHRYLVELNHKLYDNSYFEENDGWFYLKKGYEVHHKDCNHNNNSLDNLQIVSKGEHIRIHNLLKKRNRNSKGQFIKYN